MGPPPWDWEALLLPFRDPTSGRWCLGVADQRSATLLFVDTTAGGGWMPDIQTLDWLEWEDPVRRRSDSPRDMFSLKDQPGLPRPLAVPLSSPAPSRYQGGTICHN